MREPSAEEIFFFVISLLENSVFGGAGRRGMSIRRILGTHRSGRMSARREPIADIALGSARTEVFQVERDKDVPVVAHLGNTLPQRDDGRTSLKHYHKAGLLRPGRRINHISCT